MSYANCAANALDVSRFDASGIKSTEFYCEIAKGKICAIRSIQPSPSLEIISLESLTNVFEINLLNQTEQSAFSFSAVPDPHLSQRSRPSQCEDNTVADHYQLNLGSLRSSITLTLHTHHAARIW
ncbi:MAG: hypothetical protein ABI447_17590, partial [Pseudomonas sp.]